MVSISGGADSDVMLDMIQEMDLDIVDFRVVKDENDRIDVYTKHLVDGYETELNLLEESSGTRKLFGFNAIYCWMFTYGNRFGY